VKRKLFALILACLAAAGLCVPAGAEDAAQDSAIPVSENFEDMKLRSNAGAHYINAKAARHVPGQSYLYANEKGGLTLVQYYSKTEGVTVAEFDDQFRFVNTRSIPVKDLRKWGDFYAGEKYNYLFYSVDNTTLRIDRYSRDWTLLQTRDYALGNTNSFIDNDMDVAQSGSSLFIVTSHYMTSGHQANMRLQIDADTLGLVAAQTGEADFYGYCSHSFVPEVVCSGGKIYAFDYCDRIPSVGILMSAFQGGLYSGIQGRVVKSMILQDWGILASAAPVSGGAVMAYTYAPASAGNVATDVYLYHTGGTTRQVTYTGNMGTPWVAPLNGSSGFVLFNPDVRADLPGDELYYAAYAVSGGSLVVGPTRKVAGHALSDCEPIAFNNELVWFTMEKGDVVFHRLSGQTGMSRTVAHHTVHLEALEPTCSQYGLTEGVGCANCGEVLAGREEIEKLPHTEQRLPAQEATCMQEGLTQGVECSVCGEVLSGRENLGFGSHTEEILPGKPADCLSSGWTEGLKCSVCHDLLVAQEYIPKGEHLEEDYPGYAPTCVREGLTDGKKCSVCHLVTVQRESIPKSEHDPVDTPAIPPTATSVGTTAGTACTICGEQLTGGDDIPELMFTIQGQTVENGRLMLDFELIDNVYMLIIAFYDADGAMIGVDLAHESWDWEQVNRVEFDIPEGGASYRVFALDTYYSYLQPACEARGGEL